MNAKGDKQLTWHCLKEDRFQIGYRRVVRRRYRFPDGREADYDLKHEGDCVAILALTGTNEVILARQYRPGPQSVLLEIPGGGIEADETPLQAARRELLEETGYQGTLHFVAESVDCAYSTLRRFNFLATDCRQIDAPVLDENEFIEVVTLPLDEFRQHLRSGRLSDVETGYLGLDYLNLL